MCDFIIKPAQRESTVYMGPTFNSIATALFRMERYGCICLHLFFFKGKGSDGGLSGGLEGRDLMIWPSSDRPMFFYRSSPHILQFIIDTPVTSLFPWWMIYKRTNGLINCHYVLVC